MERLSIILGIGCVFFVAGIIYLIYLNVKLTSDKIDPNQCPIVRGSYGITPGTTYMNGNSLAVISKCGSRGEDICEFSAQSGSGTISASDIITYCNSYAHFCEGVAFSAASQKAYIVDTSATKTQDSTFDLFEPQNVS
jgi:hypothetical protein